MGFGERNGNPSESSGKGKLSFLLNQDDDATPAADQRYRQRTSDTRQHGVPAGYQYGAGQAHASTASLGIQSRSAGTGMATNAAGAGAHRVHTATDGAAVEKRGVRKKRQRKFACDRCGFGFYTNSDLQKHISSVHLLLRPYSCSMCDKKFGERSNATKHFKSVHERQKNAGCHLCNKVFAFKDGLVRHIRLVHENVRNFHCRYPECGQSFKQSAHLKKHEQVHARARNRALVSAARKEAARRKTRT